MKSKGEIRRIIEVVVKRLTGKRPKSLGLTLDEIAPSPPAGGKFIYRSKIRRIATRGNRRDSESRATSIRHFADTLERQVFVALGERRLELYVTQQLRVSPLLGTTTLRDFATILYDAQSHSSHRVGQAPKFPPSLMQTAMKERPFRHTVFRVPSEKELGERKRKSTPESALAKKAVAKKLVVKKAAAKKSVGQKAVAKKVVAIRAAAQPTKRARAAKVETTVMKVYFGTNRERVGGTNPNFNATRVRATTLGVCKVSVPKGHTFGLLETPVSILGIKLLPDPKKHIVLLQTVTKSERKFLEEIRETVASGNGEIFLFVHGYNVRFEDAARVTAQIAYDMKFNGAAVMFSWPSAGRLLSYTRDAGRIEPSLETFKRFLTLLVTESGAERINIIAHSMGNRLVCNALNELHLAGTAARSFEHLILAAPDVPRDRFVQMAGALTHLGKTVTLYQSSRDRAMPASEFVNGEPRAGEPILIMPGIDTIDATPLGNDLLRHSYFREAYPLLTDIFRVFEGDRPDQRIGIRPELYQGERYYAFPSIG